MAARNRSFRALLLGLLMTGDATAQGMALIAPREPDTPPVSDPLPDKRPWMQTGQGMPREAAGRLPNQTTGPKRERVVHDICIGCGAR